MFKFKKYPWQDFIKDLDTNLPLEDNLKKLYTLCGGSNYTFYSLVCKVICRYVDNYQYTLLTEDRLKINDQIYKLI